MKKVLLIAGGNSSEHYVSCRSAQSILENIDREKYEITTCLVDLNNQWYLYHGNDQDITSWQKQKITKIDNIINFLKDFAVIFPIIHGTNGEDGKLQGMLDLFNIKYVGSKTLGSAIGMDKEFMKIIFNNLNIPQVPFVVINTDYNIEDIINKMDLPLIVKPANGGSSIGITKANNEKELILAIEEAKKYDSKVIIEKYLKARELEVSVLNGEKMIISNTGEIKSANEFYDYNAKYENNKSLTIVPAIVPDEVNKTIKEYAKQAFNGINASGLARVDFFYDEDNNQIYLNEINTLPGFTTISMYPKLLINEGISYQELISILIESAK